MSYKNILVEQQGAVSVLTLNRPDSLNSFTTEMHAEVRDALEQARTDSSVRALVLTGSGRGFCAGQDLNDRAVAPGEAMPDLGESVEKNYNPLIRALTTLPKPIVCAVNGVAAGAGANIALACDVVLAARSASFIQPFCKLGLIPDSGGTWILPRLVGMARARGLALLGDKISAEQALAWGMIWQVIEPEQLHSEALRLAQQLAAGPTRGYGLIKQALLASAGNSLEQQLQLEMESMREAGRSHDYREGVTAFMEKRAPQFTGK